jgi:hypothetical protein
MIKKILLILLAVSVLITGYISLRKVNFWQRSAMVFNLNSTSQPFNGRGERGTGSFQDREGFVPREGSRGGLQRPERMNIPDSLRGRFEGRGQRPGMGFRNSPDSLRTGRMMNDSTFIARGLPGGGMRGMDRDGGREFRGGSTINLRNVFYYLAVFAFFTVIVIYIDKAYCLIFKKKNTLSE